MKVNNRQFNIRVYGILLNKSKEVLLSDERRHGKSFTKFPGGGLEFGEGIKDCLIREFKEELNIEIEVVKLFYVTDFFQLSAFNEKEQIISIYYIVTTKSIDKIAVTNKPFSFKTNKDKEAVRWKKMEKMKQEDVTFPIDKKVVALIKEKIENHINLF